MPYGVPLDDPDRQEYRRQIREIAELYGLAKKILRAAVDSETPIAERPTAQQVSTAHQLLNHCRNEAVAIENLAALDEMELELLEWRQDGGKSMETTPGIPQP